jgi:hypothetical protein
MEGGLTKKSFNAREKSSNDSEATDSVFEALDVTVVGDRYTQICTIQLVIAPVAYHSSPVTHGLQL